MRLQRKTFSLRRPSRPPFSKTPCTLCKQATGVILCHTHRPNGQLLLPTSACIKTSPRCFLSVPPLFSRPAGEADGEEFHPFRVRRVGVRDGLLDREPKRADTVGGAVRRLRQRCSGASGVDPALASIQFALIPPQGGGCCCMNSRLLLWR